MPNLMEFHCASKGPNNPFPYMLCPRDVFKIWGSRGQRLGGPGVDHVQTKQMRAMLHLFPLWSARVAARGTYPTGGATGLENQHSDWLVRKCRREIKFRAETEVADWLLHVVSPFAARRRYRSRGRNRAMIGYGEECGECMEGRGGIFFKTAK